MKSRQSGTNHIARSLFILAVTAVAFLPPATSYSASSRKNNDEYLISLPDKKASSTKTRITTEKKEKEQAAQPAEPVQPVSRQSLLRGRGAESDSAAAEPAKNSRTGLLGGRSAAEPSSSAAEPAQTSRSGLLRGPGGGRKNADDEEYVDDTEVESVPNVTKTVTSRTEGNTTYETTTETDGDTVTETEVVTEHTRGMIVETTIITETKNGKVVRKTKSRTSRKEDSGASTNKQTKTVLGRATGNAPKKDADAQTAGTAAASKPASSAGTARTQVSGKTATSSNTKPAATVTKKPAEETTTAAQPVVEEPVEPVIGELTPGFVDDPVPEEIVQEPDPVLSILGPVPADPVDTEPVTGAETKKPDYSDQKSSGTVVNPFGVARPADGE